MQKHQPKIAGFFFWMWSEGGFVYLSELYLEGKIRGTHSHAPHYLEIFLKLLLLLLAVNSEYIYLSTVLEYTFEYLHFT